MGPMYSVECVIEYASTRLIPEVDSEHSVVQNKWTIDSFLSTLVFQK